MLSALLIAAQVGPAPIDRSPRLRRTLSNGASVGAEARPGERRIVLQVVLANPEGDRAAIYGHRHLLEHLVAARDPELDRRLETVGGAMGASTGRETMRFWISVPPEGLALGLDALKALLKPISLTEDAVARERRILAREIALFTPEELAGREAWITMYGEAGNDPLGMGANLEDAVPPGLERLWREALVGSRLSLFVSGPVELDSTVERLERLARTFPEGPRTEWSPRKSSAPSVALASGVYALTTESVDSRSTLAALATALALASEVEGSSVTYTPSPRAGAVLLSNVAAAEGLRAVVRRGDAGLRNRALNLARAWLASRLDDAEGSSEFRATLSAFRSGLVPERLTAILSEVREADLDAAFARWKALAR